MTWTSSIYDHSIISPSSVTLTFNLPEKNVSNATSTPHGDCAKQLCHSCINIEVMARTSLIYNHFINHLTFKCELDFQPT